MSDLNSMLATHQSKYKPEAWKSYSLAELCNWVDNFTKRAGHRTDPTKKASDLQNAQNYLDMIREDSGEFIRAMQEKIDVARGSSCGPDCCCDK